MFNWLSNWVVNHAPTPEKAAEQALNEVRLELFRAEQKVLEAQIYANYYRGRLKFLETVRKEGIEAVTDQREKRQGPQAVLRTHPNWHQSSNKPDADEVRGKAP